MKVRKRKINEKKERKLGTDVVLYCTLRHKVLGQVSTECRHVQVRIPSTLTIVKFILPLPLATSLSSLVVFLLSVWQVEALPVIPMQQGVERGPGGGGGERKCQGGL